MKNNQSAKNSITDRIDRILPKLKAIGSLEPGDYWNTYDSTVQRSGIKTSFARTFFYSNEGRDLNIADIAGCFRQSFELLEDIHEILKSIIQTRINNTGVPYIMETGPNPREENLTFYEKVIIDIKSAILIACYSIQGLAVTYHNDEIAKHAISKISTNAKEKYRQFELKLPESNAHTQSTIVIQLDNKRSEPSPDHTIIPIPPIIKQSSQPSIELATAPVAPVAPEPDTEPKPSPDPFEKPQRPKKKQHRLDDKQIDQLLGHVESS